MNSARKRHAGAGIFVAITALAYAGYYFMGRSKSITSTTKPTPTPQPTPAPQPTGSSAPRYSFNVCPFLQQGSTGGIVRNLQSALDFLGFSVVYPGGPAGGVDGDFGPVTNQAVRDFQSSSGISVDGIVGPQTYGALSKAMKAKGGAWTCGSVPEPSHL